MEYKFSLYVDDQWVSNFNSDKTVDELQKEYETLFEGDKVCVWKNEED